MENSSLNNFYICAPFLFIFMKKVVTLVKNHDFYMKIALREAQKAFLIGEVPVGAVIVKDNKILAKAHNLKDTKFIVTKHAELLAIERASKKLHNWRLNDCILYITLAPCPMCASAIEQARFSQVIYGAESNNAKNNEIVSKIFDDSPIIIKSGVLSVECASIIKKFFSNIR